MRLRNGPGDRIYFKSGPGRNWLRNRRAQTECALDATHYTSVLRRLLDSIHMDPQGLRCHHSRSSLQRPLASNVSTNIPSSSTRAPVDGAVKVADQCATPVWPLTAMTCDL